MARPALVAQRTRSRVCSNPLVLAARVITPSIHGAKTRAAATPPRRRLRGRTHSLSATGVWSSPTINCKPQELARDGWRRLETAGDGWRRLEMAETGGDGKKWGRGVLVRNSHVTV
eukprot:2225433-Prymnesium_polylepis.1